MPEEESLGTGFAFFMTHNYLRFATAKEGVMSNQFQLTAKTRQTFKHPSSLLAIFLSVFVLLEILTPSYSQARVVDDCDTRIHGRIRRYVPKVSKEKRTTLAVVILPPTGGKNVFDNHLARELCYSGVDMTILDYAQVEINLEHDENPNKPVALHHLHENRIHVDADFLGVYEYGARSVMDELNNFLSDYQDELKNKKIVLMGSSLGGFFTSIIFGSVSKTNQWNREGKTDLSDAELKIKESVEIRPYLKRLVGAIVVVAGGSVADVWSESTRPEIIDAVKLRKDIFNLRTKEEYVSYFDAHNDFDPIKVANPNDRDKILFFNSKADTIVPYKFQEKLWAAWGQPMKATLNLQHMYAIGEVYLYPEHIETILGFLKATWPEK